jgi:hypothetical protein
MRFLPLLIFGVPVKGSDWQLKFRYIFLDMCYRKLHVAAAKRYFEHLKKCWQKCRDVKGQYFEGNCIKGFFCATRFKITNCPGNS